MQFNKKTLATILIGLAAVIGIVSMFCFFGAAEKLVANAGIISETVKGPSMFIAMFGGTWSIMMPGMPEPYAQHVDLVPGMTVLFVLELVILLLSVIVIAGNVSKKLKENTTICLMVIVSLLTLVTLIMSFCTVSICGDADFGGTSEGVSFAIKLGAGPISYSILGIIGIISNVTGIALYKKAN